MFPFSVLRKPTSMLPAYTTDTGTASILDASGDIATIDVRHMTNLEVYVVQVNDAGTCTIDIERTLDGVNWDPVAQFTEASFPAGNNMAQASLLVDSNGLPLLAKQIRVKATAIAGGGTYNALVYGLQLNSNERLIVDPTGIIGPDTVTAGILDAVGDIIQFSTKGLTNIEVLVNQITDAGTVAIAVERSCDGGASWDLIQSIADTDLPAGANKSVPVSFSGTGGRPLHADLVRARVTAITGGTYSAGCVGIQLPGFR